MKNLKKLAYIAALPFLFSCSDTVDQSIDVTQVCAYLQPFEDEDANYVTRTQIDVSASDQISYKWGVGDVLGIFPDQGTQVSFELSASSLSADGLSATFDGGAWALKSGHSYYSYFPFSYGCFDKTVNKTNIPVSYLGQKQAAFNDTSNAGQYDFNAAGSSSASGGGIAFNFKRLGALLRVKFTLPQTATYKKLILKTGTSSAIPVSGTVDLSAASIAYAPSTYASSLSVDLNNVSGTVGQTAYVYMMLPPMTLKTQGVTMTATLEYDDKSTTYNLCTAGTTTPNTPDFKADIRYKRDAVYASGDPEGTMSGGNDEGQQIPEYVDLGLTSGTLWATCNVGATTPEGYGDYFAWGEIETYYSNQSPLTWKDGKTNGYSMLSYKYAASCSPSLKVSKYCTQQYYGTLIDNKNVLELDDDAAYNIIGNDWKTPTKEQFTELINECKWSWNSTKGGYVVSSKKSGNTNSLFFPCTGFYEGDYYNASASFCFYWTSSLNVDNPYNACYVFVHYSYSSASIAYDFQRGCGLPIRPVRK